VFIFAQVALGAFELGNARLQLPYAIVLGITGAGARRALDLTIAPVVLLRGHRPRTTLSTERRGFKWRVMAGCLTEKGATKKARKS
jgi:hypothetical protein